MGANNSTTLGFKYLQQVSLFYVCKPEAPVPRINNTTTTQSLFTIPGSKNPRLLHARFYPLVRQGEGKKGLFRPRPKVVVFNRHTDVLHPPKSVRVPKRSRCKSNIGRERFLGASVAGVYMYREKPNRRHCLVSQNRIRQMYLR
jgi:hypothetical protein